MPPLGPSPLGLVYEQRCHEVALAGLAKRARFYYATVAGQLGRDWAAVHQQIVDAIADRDPDTAGALVREHIAHTGDAVSRLLALGEP